ncbi:MAG: hypothetical protein Q8Q26_15885 [Pseudorhodobacter sp.]|nr:hypothetical protein [Pseudorhodobacter sp.]
MHLFPLSLLSALAVTFAAGFAAAAQICVVNGADAPYLFTAEARDGQRASATLAPGAQLCLNEAPDHPGGVVAAFDGANQLEGCSHLVGPGASDTLLIYVDFDRCAWTSNSG